MATSADILQSIFQVSGLSATVAAFGQVAAATQKLAVAQAKSAATTSAFAGMSSPAALKATAQATAHLTQASAAAAATQSVLFGAGVAGATALVAGLEDAISHYVQLGTTIANLRDLSGASTSQSAGAASLFRAAGIGDAQEMREIIRITKDLHSANGSRGMAMLGVTPNANQTGLQMFDEIIDKASQMQSGLRRTQALEEIFGARMVQSLLPLLRMTKEQRDEARKMGEAFSGPALADIQEFTAETSLLGQAIMTYLVYPLARYLIPQITAATRFFKELVEWFDSPLKQGLATFILIGGSIMGIGIAIGTAITALKSFNAVLRITAAWDAVIAALQGPSGWAALAVAGVVAVGVGVGTYYYADKNAGENKTAQEQNTDAVQKQTDAIYKQSALFSRLFGNNAPSQLGQGSAMAQLEREMALGAIG